MVLTTESVDEILKGEYSNQNSAITVLRYGVIYSSAF